MSNFFQQASFFISAPDLRACPPDTGAEAAFAGRSNSGKSSALNALIGGKSLARVSKTPGRTRMINFFRLDEATRLVDLPGYGFAKAPLSIKIQWEQNIAEYLSCRGSLKCLILLTDIRRPLTGNDRALLEWVGGGLPIHVLLTKADKFKRGAAANALLKTGKFLQQNYPEVSISLFSALKKQGLTELREVLAKYLEIGACQDVIS